jgi:hypothetical protein
MRAINFCGRGLSDRTIQALLDHGIDFPKPLLFMEPSQFKKISGMGKAGFNQIMRYREKFTPHIHRQWREVVATFLERLPSVS